MYRIYMKAMKERAQKYNGGISLLRSTFPLLLLLLLSGRTHLLAEGHVGDLKAGDGADTDVEDGEEEDADNTTHEDACETTLARYGMRQPSRCIRRTGREELVLLKQRQVGLGV